MVGATQAMIVVIAKSNTQYMFAVTPSREPNRFCLDLEHTFLNDFHGHEIDEPETKHRPRNSYLSVPPPLLKS